MIVEWKNESYTHPMNEKGTYTHPMKGREPVLIP